MKRYYLILIVLIFSLISCLEQAEDSNDSSTDSSTDTTPVYSGITNQTEVFAGNEYCEYGGTKFETGLDNGEGEGIAGDSILQDGEIDNTSYACNGEPGTDGSDGEDGTDGEGGTDSTTDTTTTYNLIGKSQKGLCFEDSEILVWPLEDGTLTQSGNHFIAFTGENGTYNVRADLKNTEDEYALVCFKGWCDDEANGGNAYYEMCEIRNVLDPVSNINPLTKISIPVAEDLLDNEFGDVEESLIEAERLTCEYLSMPNSGRFSQMNLENDSTGDAVLALTSSMILYGRSEAEQGDYMSTISTGINNNDLSLKAEILESYDYLPLIQIKENLEKTYPQAPPFWRLMFPDYYADLLERTPTVFIIYNVNDNTHCSFDQPTYNLYGTPFTPGPGIETSKYIAINFPLDADISIWSVGVDGNGNPAPGTKLLDITALREIILDNPVKLSYNGLLGDDHGIVADTEYYFRIRKDEDFTLSKSCGGDRLTTAYTLASDDEGTTWIGHNNNGDKFFYFSGLKYYTTN